jgi:hypothetical protein
MPDVDQPLTAYEIYPNAGMTIVPAPVDRRWMSESPQRFAYRCLPLNIANQNGWWILSPCDFSAYWYGGTSKMDIEIRYAGEIDNRICSHFGEGVLTFTLPYLFRTPPGINLWVKGPANHIKEGIQALEGVVEADWTASTFTMNWKFTKANEWISWSKHEPFCMLVPLPRGLTESLDPVVKPISANPELKAQFELWDKSRTDFLAKLMGRDPETTARGWQKEYFQGKGVEGVAKEHQTKLMVKPFKGSETPT